MKKRYLIPGDYMADPSVHVFEGKVYIYPSHDWESGIPEDDWGAHFDMRDYHVFSLEDVMEGDVTDHGRVLDKTDVPWVKRQMWDCDCCEKDGKYYLYFPAKDIRTSSVWEWLSVTRLTARLCRNRILSGEVIPWIRPYLRMMTVRYMFISVD